MSKVVVRKIRLNSFLQASGDPKIKNMKYYPGAKTMIMAPLDKTGEYPMTGLSPEDESRFEVALGYPKGHLAKSSNFWAGYSVTIPEDGLELDTTIPGDELKWTILSQSRLVAKSLAELSMNPDADFVMTNEDQEADAKNKKRDAKKRAFIKLGQMSLDDYRDYLIAKGTSGVSTLSSKRIQDMVETDAEEGPRKFVEFLDDPNYKDKLLIANLVNAGLLKMQGARYYDAASGQTVGANLLQAIDYLNAPKNQNVLITLSNQLEEIQRGGSPKRIFAKGEDEENE